MGSPNRKAYCFSRYRSLFANTVLCGAIGEMKRISDCLDETRFDENAAAYRESKSKART